jgi:hypothetical protein
MKATIYDTYFGVKNQLPPEEIMMKWTGMEGFFKKVQEAYDEKKSLQL